MNNKMKFTKEEVVKTHNFWVSKGSDDDASWSDERINNLVEVLNMASDALEIVGNGSKTNIGYSTQFFPNNAYVCINLRWEGYLSSNNEYAYMHDAVLKLNVDDMNDDIRKKELAEEIENFKNTWNQKV